MPEGYTQEASNLIFDLLDRETAAIWEDIESTPTDTTAELWAKKLKKIAQDYSLSSRFALMRILYCRAHTINISSNSISEMPATDVDFEIFIYGKSYQFKDVSLEHASNLLPEENLQYISCLMDMAELQADSDPEVNEYIISRAWYDEASANKVSEYLNKTNQTRKNKKYKAPLTREEAFQLGHILDFSLEEMQWFMLRVFDVADGFRFNHSEDLIEAYGFLTGASWQHVQQLKEQYEEICSQIEKSTAIVADNGWTKDVSDTLFGQAERWKLYPETRDERFLSWMKTQAPRLDVPSQTAGRIYRNLAAFAHDLITDEEITPSEEEFVDCILDVCEEYEDNGSSRRLFYEDGILSPAKCKLIADELMLKNNTQSESTEADNTKSWHVLSAKQDGTLSAAGGTINSGRTRVADILSGKVQAEKADMLYLLWFTANLIWEISDIPDTNGLCCRILDFMDTAKSLLSASLMPDFYPPHPIEQSMLLSIVNGRTEGNEPAFVYEYMLQSLKKTRERQPGSRKHDKAFKLHVVTHYRAHPELSLTDCALLFEISPKTLSAWQKDLLEKGLIE